MSKVLVDTIKKCPVKAYHVAMGLSVAVATSPYMAFAADSLDPDVKAALVTGLANSGGMVKDVVLVAVPTTIAAVALTGGAKYAIKWVKGIFAKAQ